MIETLRKNNLVTTNDSVSYIGRLDPMADGVLLLLTQPTHQTREIYKGLPKRYRFTCLLGLETDSYDLLGLPQMSQYPKDKSYLNNLPDILDRYRGTQEQAYPAYSSARVKGHPLFYWARHGKLNTITIPTHTITISKLTLEQISQLSVSELRDHLHTSIPQVKGDFRQGAILQAWDDILRIWPYPSFDRVLITIECSSGTYVRQLCHQLGKDLGCGALASQITRTAVGSFHIEDSLRLNPYV